MSRTVIFLSTRKTAQVLNGDTEKMSVRELNSLEGKIQFKVTSLIEELRKNLPTILKVFGLPASLKSRMKVETDKQSYSDVEVSHTLEAVHPKTKEQFKIEMYVEGYPDKKTATGQEFGWQYGYLIDKSRGHLTEATKEISKALYKKEEVFDGIKIAIAKVFYPACELARVEQDGTGAIVKMFLTCKKGDSAHASKLKSYRICSNTV